MVDILEEQGIIPGIKVDTGLKPLCGGGEGETWCSGLDGLFDPAPLRMHVVHDSRSGGQPSVSTRPWDCLRI